MSFGRTLCHSLRAFTFLACVVACQGEDPVLVSGGSSGTPVGDGGALAPDAAPSLGCPLGCLPPAPAGWTGPSAIYDGPAETKPAACPAPYSLKELEAHQGMSAPPAVCSCGDPAFADQKCSVTVEQWSTSSCSGTPLGKAEGTVPGNTCLAKPGSGAYIKFSPGKFSADCSFPSPTTTRPDPTYERLDIACGLPQIGSCSGRPDCTATPLPDAPFGRLCIHKDGDVGCPSEDYAARFLAYRGVVDERSCTPCTGKASGTCGTSPKVSSSDICMTGNVDAQVGACQTAGSYLNIAGMGVASSACEPQGGAPTGQVTDKDPITFCCNR